MFVRTKEKIKNNTKKQNKNKKKKKKLKLKLVFCSLIIPLGEADEDFSKFMHTASNESSKCLETIDIISI
jgi:hypothetical protein